MSNLIKIASRNIFKNKHRSLVTFIAIASGFAAVSLFRGYSSNIYYGLRQTAIRSEGLAHLTIYKEGMLEKGKIEPDKYMFSQQEIQKIIKVVGDEEHVVLVTPQLRISGLISNGHISTIFLANGVIPQDERTIKGGWSRHGVETVELSEGKPYEVILAEDLANSLDLKPGNDAVLIANTLDGQLNALDIEVLGLYNTGTAATNDKFMRIPFSYAQSLYDTDSADRILVLLDNWKNTEIVRKRLLNKLSMAGFNCEIKTWDELSLMYSKVKGMFDIIFTFLFLIVLIIVIMSVINTMGMAVVERTKEIGTLRALGLKRRGVKLLFAIEGGMIGFFGSILGFGLNVVVWAIIKAIRPTYIPPGISNPVPLIVLLVPQIIVMLLIFFVILSIIAAIIPASRAAKQNVVDALGHV